MSRRLDDTWQNWTEPENLGNDLNSAEDDVFFNIPPSGKYAYYSKSNSEFDADIHKLLNSGAGEDETAFVLKRAKEFEADFETEHPTMVRILSEVIEALSRMGI